MEWSWERLSHASQCDALKGKKDRGWFRPVEAVDRDVWWAEEPQRF